MIFHLQLITAKLGGGVGSSERSRTPALKWLTMIDDAMLGCLVMSFSWLFNMSCKLLLFG